MLKASSADIRLIVIIAVTSGPFFPDVSAAVFGVVAFLHSITIISTTIAQPTISMAYPFFWRSNVASAVNQQPTANSSRAFPCKTRARLELILIA